MKITTVSIPLSLAICIVFVITGLWLKNYKEVNQTNAWCHESSIAAIFGLLVGGLIQFSFNSSVLFDSDLFFYLVIPPIIFSAGYSLKRKRFFRYGVAIAIFGIVGTIINILLTGFAAHFYSHLVSSTDTNLFLTWPKSFLLASVLTASDEVSAMSLVRMRDYPRLGALIFGEGVLNDVLSVVLFKSLLTYLKPTWYGNQPPPEEREVVIITELFITVFIQMVAACIIGLSCGLLNARFLKTFPVSRRHPVHQTSLVLLFGLLSYSLAEVFGVSGILSLFVAAVTLAHYSWHSLSKSAQISTKLSFNAISDIAEGFAFAYVGLSMWQYTSKDMSLLFSVYMLCIIILVRVFTIMTLCYVCKPFNSDFDLPVREQLGLSLAGLVRGCLCWAQILQVSEESLLVTTTLFIVLFTTLVSGFVLPVLMPVLVPDPKYNSLIPDRKLSKSSYNVIKDSDNTFSNNYCNNNDIDKTDIQSTYSMHLDTSKETDDLLSHSRYIPGKSIFLADSLFPQNGMREDVQSKENDDNQIDDLPTFSLAYIMWVRFDEIIMKPLFGGSIPDTSRSQILQNIQQASLCAMVTSPVKSKEGTSRVLYDDEEEDNLFDDTFISALTAEEDNERSLTRRVLLQHNADYTKTEVANTLNSRTGTNRSNSVTSHSGHEPYRLHRYQALTPITRRDGQYLTPIQLQDKSYFSTSNSATMSLSQDLVEDQDSKPFESFPK